jgi:glycosyltransferase involved in cell wall biosynthesis
MPADHPQPSMSPAISVILPTYNRAGLLARAVSSVVAQSWTDWELIIVDDGSTDNTAEVIDGLMRTDARIHTVAQANAGPSNARNRGYSLSHGALITYLDSDDEYLPDHLAVRVQFMRDHPDIDCIHGGCHVIGDAGRKVVPDMHDPSRMIPIAECVVGATIVIRSPVLRTLGGWHNGYAEDAELIARVCRAHTVVHVDVPTYLYHRDVIDSRCDRQKEALR